MSDIAIRHWAIRHWAIRYWAIRHLVLLRGIAFLVATAGLSAAPALSTTAMPVHRVALIVGANDGGEGRQILRYAQSDAEKVGGVFMEIGRVKSGDVVRLDQPTVKEFNAALATTEAALVSARAAGAHTEVILYYSGHSDEEGLLLGSQRFPYQALRRRVDALSADVRVVILDSCASGAITRRKGGVHRPAFLVDDLHRTKGFAYLTSSAADEVAQESDRIGGSFFTQALITGLRGAADIESDGRVTLHEAYQFAYRSTLSQTERTLLGPQHAAYEISLRGTSDVVMTDLSAADARLSLASSLDGAVSLRDVRDNLVVAFDKSPGRQETLALPQGRYILTLRNRAGILEANVDVGEGLTHITPFDFSALIPQNSVARGDAPTGRAASDVDNLPSPLLASATSEIERFREQARLREAKLRYDAEHIDVREDGGEIGLYLGTSQVRLEGADFYDRIGRDDLAAQFRANASSQHAFSLGGLAIELAGVLVAGGALAAAAIIGTGPVAGVVFIGMAIAATLVSLSGAGVASVGILSDPNPLNSRQSAALARQYNRQLRQDLGLRSDVVTSRPTSGSSMSSLDRSAPLPPLALD